MITINKISEKYFDLDGIRFARIYQPLKQGLENIGIYGIHDTKNQLVSSTRFDQFRIDGVIYGTQALTIAALLAAVWAGASEYDVELLKVTVANSGNLTIRKIYASIAAMNADLAAPVDAEGLPILKGQLVIISSPDEFNGNIYRKGLNAWNYICKIGDLTYKLEENDILPISQRISNIENSTADYVLLTDGIPEPENGYYNFSQHIFIANGGAFKSIKHRINPENSYFVTSIVQSGALALYWDINNVFISSEKNGNNSDAILYTRERLTVPSNAAYVGLTNQTTLVYPILETNSIFRNNVILPIEKHFSDIEDSTSDFVLIEDGIEEAQNGYYHSNNGVFYPLQAYNSIKFKIDSSKYYYATLENFGTYVGLAYYYNKLNQFISAEKINTNAVFVREQLTIPDNTEFIGLTTRSETVIPVLESRSIFRENVILPISQRISNIENSTADYVLLTDGIPEPENGYYNFSQHIFVANGGAFKSIKHRINPENSYFVTSIVQSGALALYWDINNIFISSEKNGNNADVIVYTRERLTVPSNAAYVGLTNQTTLVYPVLEYRTIFRENVIMPILQTIQGGNYWNGKKVAWYGTSIPAGYPFQNNQNVYSYANKACNQLGAAIQNYCVPAGIIRRYKADGTETPLVDRSFTHPMGSFNYITNMLNLIGTANEPDLFVFDYGVNDYNEDYTDIQAGNWDMNSIDTKYFHGALNFCIKGILNANPKARIALFTHYSDDHGVSPGENNWGKLNQVIEAVAKYWNLPVCKVHELSGLVNKSTVHAINTIDAYMPDHIHPATDPTGKLVELLTRIAFDFLKGL